MRVVVEEDERIRRARAPPRGCRCARKPRFSALRSMRTPVTPARSRRRRLGRRVVERRSPRSCPAACARRCSSGRCRSAAACRRRGSGSTPAARRSAVGQRERRDRRFEAQRSSAACGRNRARPDELDPQPAGQRRGPSSRRIGQREARLACASAATPIQLRARVAAAPTLSRCTTARSGAVSRQLVDDSSASIARARGGEHRLQPLDRALQLRAFAQLARDLARRARRSRVRAATSRSRSIRVIGRPSTRRANSRRASPWPHRTPALRRARQATARHRRRQRARRRTGRASQLGQRAGPSRRAAGGDRGDVAREVVVRASSRRSAAGPARPRRQPRPRRSGGQQRVVPLGRRRVPRRAAGARGRPASRSANAPSADATIGSPVAIATDSVYDQVSGTCAGNRNARRAPPRRAARARSPVVVGAGGAISDTPARGRQRSRRSSRARGTTSGRPPCRASRAQPIDDREALLRRQVAEERDPRRHAATSASRASGCGQTSNASAGKWRDTRAATSRVGTIRRAAPASDAPKRRARHRCRAAQAPAARRGRRCSRRRRARRSNRPSGVDQHPLRTDRRVVVQRPVVRNAERLRQPEHRARQAVEVMEVDARRSQRAQQRRTARAVSAGSAK